MSLITKPKKWLFKNEGTERGRSANRGNFLPLCASSEEPIAAAEANLPRNLCPLIKASYGFTLTDTCPYFYFSDFIVGETTCDGKKKMFELMNEIKETFVLPTGWNGRETARPIYEILQKKGYTENMRCTATGYGRVSVGYADKVITEITCHGKGGWALFGQNGTIVDIGGQDTKVIRIQDGQVSDFLMNDKCAAGTGKFIEVMANRLGTDLTEFYAEAEAGIPVPISAMCTVFAESEVIGHIGEGKSRKDIAAGVIDSVASRVSHLVSRFGITGGLYLTGGLCDSPYFIRILSQKTNRDVTTHPMARYAGSLGAALAAAKQQTIDWSSI